MYHRDLSHHIPTHSNVLSLHDALPILSTPFFKSVELKSLEYYKESAINNYPELQKILLQKRLAEEGIKAKKANYYPDIADRKSTRLNSSHVKISYAVFCFIKNNNNTIE